MRKANALEKLRHEFHMQDIWEEASVHYREFASHRLPASCDCLQEELIVFYLKERASFIRAERRDGRSYVVEVGELQL